MVVARIMSKTDLARRTRQVVDQARRGRAVIIESYGEEQVAVVDAGDYRCLQAMAAYYSLPQHPAPALDSALAPRGLEEEEVQGAVAAAGGDAQAAWDRVLTAYFDGDISLGRAAHLLRISRFDLQDRLNRLGLPLRLGPANGAEAQREVEVLRPTERRP
jgi:prevent-host-death family protein